MVGEDRFAFCHELLPDPYLTDEIRFRLRMLAFQRGKEISSVADEILEQTE